ncbi:MAG: aromatic acid exporter family protein [Eubacteriales bacterium]
MLHIWTARSITASSLLNEATLMAIGILMGILMNLYMPNQIKKIKTYQAIIDRHFKELCYVFQTALYFRIDCKAYNTNLMYYPLFFKNQFKLQIYM